MVPDDTRELFVDLRGEERSNLMVGSSFEIMIDLRFFGILFI